MSRSLFPKHTAVPGIYMISHRASGMVYIGQSRNIRSRWTQHIREARGDSKTRLHRALREHGWNAFDWQVLQEESDQARRDQLETDFIHKYRADSGRNLNSVQTNGRLTPKVDSIHVAHEKVLLAKQQAESAEYRKLREAHVASFGPIMRMIHNDPEIAAVFASIPLTIICGLLAGWNEEYLGAAIVLFIPLFFGVFKALNAVARIHLKRFSMPARSAPMSENATLIVASMDSASL